MSVGLVSPCVSVIIAAYNAARHLRATLESVGAQTLTDWEALVVDDGSTDDTCSLVDEMAQADPRIRLIRQRNLGVGAARNAAIRQARGRFIAPLDADDLWTPEKLARQVEVMEAGGAEVGLVYCWSDRIDHDGRFLNHGTPYTVEGFIHRALLLYNLLGNASVPLLRASVLQEVGLYLTREEQQGAQGCEDWDLYLRVAEEYAVRVVPDYLVKYRQHQTGMSVDLSTMARSYQHVFRRARGRAPDLPARLFRWSEGYFYGYLAAKNYQWSRYQPALGAILHAWRVDPLLLLSPRLRRFACGSVIHGLTGDRWRRRRESRPGLAVAGPALVDRVQHRRLRAAAGAPALTPLH